MSAHSAVLEEPTTPVAPRPEMREALDTMLTTLVRIGGSDLHLTVDAPPMVRINGDLQPLPDYPKMTSRDTAELVRSLLTDAQWARFEREQEIDLAYDLPAVSRFRVNCF